MVSRRFIKIQVFLSYFTILLNCNQCSNEDYYYLQTNQDSVLVKGSPVMFDAGIVGFLDEVQNSDTASLAKFCIPDAVRIPKNSKVYVGFIKAFSVYGVKIVSSNEAEFITEGGRLYGLPTDSINLSLPPQDTALANKLIDIMKDFSESQKKKKK